MSWLLGLIHSDSVAQAVLVLSLVAALGLSLGSLKIKGVGLGIAGVLFSGLAIGHLGVAISPPVLEFAREFGLILFVFTIGMQVGPGFFASLRKQGLPLNIMAGAIVVLGAAITVAIAKLAGVPMAAAVGLFAGATTNTPSLGAAQEALRVLPHLPSGSGVLPGLGYAVAYPFGILGIIITMVALRALLRVDLKKETAELLGKITVRPAPLCHMSVLVTNPGLEGKRLDELRAFASMGVVVSRIKHGNQVDLAKPERLVHVGDTLLAVGPDGEVATFRSLVGELSHEDLRRAASNLVMRRVIVTKKGMLGKTLNELKFLENDVTVTRVTRAEVELSATPARSLQFGDSVVIVGREEDIDRVSASLGNAMKQLNHTEWIPVFIGIGLGVLVGTIPIGFPGVPAPVKLGLAGGPLLAAILLGRLGRIGPLVWYMPGNANFAIREIGMVLFLACVGLHAGEKFIDTLLHGGGFKWMALASLITVVPLLAVGLFARIFLKTNYVSICGLLAGSMTDPPALAFANAITGSDAPATSYATVYPLTMLLRVICAQLLILVFLT